MAVQCPIPTTRFTRVSRQLAGRLISAASAFIPLAMLWLLAAVVVGGPDSGSARSSVGPSVNGGFAASDMPFQNDEWSAPKVARNSGDASR